MLRNSRKVAGLFVCLWAAFLQVSAQDERELVKAIDYGDPSVHGQARGKGLSLTYDRYLPYTVN
ncbi:MAG: hypothetical protein EOP51_26765, partial [Sphingobacteriales bacterium]